MSSVAETLQPIRPGEPGRKSAFWNGHAKRFIFPPAFEITPLASVSIYRVSVLDDRGEPALEYETGTPWAPLTNQWSHLEPGKYRFQVFPVGSQADTAIVDRPFMKSPAFQDPGDGFYDYKEQGLRSLEALFEDYRAQTWLETNKPNADYPLWVHPTKIMGGLVRGMVMLARLSDNPETVSKATDIAVRVADFLLDLREKPGTPLEYWTPTYWDGVPREKHPIYMDRHMSLVPAEGSEALMNLYDLTGDQKYFDAVISIYRTYQNTQLPSGTWPLLISIDTGEPVRSNALIPTRVIRLLDRLDNQYGITEFREMRERAWRWCLSVPTLSFAWEAQFEDTLPKPLYRNMSHREASELALLIFNEPKISDTEQALAFDLVRYVEDQFVVWSEKDPVLWTNFFREGTGWNGNDPETGKDWFLPSATEQYAFYTPIAAATATVSELFLKMWRVTGNRDYLEKGRALADAIVRGQQYHGNGEIPTHLRRTLPEKNWINVGVNAALMLIEHDKDLSYRQTGLE